MLKQCITATKSKEVLDGLFWKLFVQLSLEFFSSLLTDVHFTKKHNKTIFSLLLNIKNSGIQVSSKILHHNLRDSANLFISYKLRLGDDFLWISLLLMSPLRLHSLNHCSYF